MRKKIIIQRFNMIEITLALAILGIGIASIMVLFPVGINANTAAIADNNIADVAEYLLGYVQMQVNDDLNNGKTMIDASTLLGSLKTESGRNTDTISSFSDIGGLTNLKKASSDNTIFRYEQTSVVNGETVIDFNAEARLWDSDVTIDYRNWSAAGAPYVPDAKIQKGDNYERWVYLETSWPADAPYKVTEDGNTVYPREKRIFIMDFFNPAYALTPEVGSTYNGVF